MLGFWKYGHSLTTLAHPAKFGGLSASGPLITHTMHALLKTTTSHQWVASEAIDPLSEVF